MRRKNSRTSAPSVHNSTSARTTDASSRRSVCSERSRRTRKWSVLHRHNTISKQYYAFNFERTLAGGYQGTNRLLSPQDRSLCRTPARSSMPPEETLNLQFHQRLQRSTSKPLQRLRGQRVQESCRMSGSTHIRPDSSYLAGFVATRNTRSPIP